MTCKSFPVLPCFRGRQENFSFLKPSDFMKRFRYAIRQFHRWSGLLVAIPFAVISITGACLAFEPQFLRLMHSELYELPRPYATDEVSIRSVSEKVERQLPDGMTLGALQIGRPDEAWIYEISSMRKAELFVDPSSGKILGMIDHDQGGFYQLRKLHRWLGDTLNRESDAPCVGRIVVGVFTAWSILVILSGFYLWFPRSRKSWALRFRWPGWFSAGYAPEYQRHTLIGIWCGVPVIALALTGLTWSFPAYRDSFFALWGADYSQRKIKSAEADTTDCRYLWDQAWPLIRQAHPSLKKVQFEETMVEITSLRPFPGITVTDRYLLSSASGGLNSFPREAQRARSVRAGIVLVHEGLWMGVFSQCLTFLWALSGAYLSWSGIRMWRLRRLRKK